MKIAGSLVLGLALCGLAAGASLGSGDCSDYIDLSGQALPISVNGTTVGATSDYGPFPSCPDAWQFRWFPPSCYGPDVTYKWTPPEDGRYTISLRGSGYDTGLLVYRFTCPDEPSYPADLLWGDEDAGCIPQFGRYSELYALPLSAGQPVLIVVDGYGSSAGPFQLSISEYNPARDPGELDAFIESTMEANHIPGLSAAAIRGGEVVWSGNYGYADISGNIAPADSTLFFLDSISMTFVGVALMQLWEQGLFDLDDDVNMYLPWPVRNPWYPNEPITIRMLMTHTSTIRDYSNILNSVITSGADSPIALEDFLYNYLTPGGVYYAPANFDVIHAPPSYCYYSRVGAALGGYLVERIDPAGRSLEDYCQQAIFGPLGMDETSWFLANLDQSHIAVPYHWNGSGYTALAHLGVPWYPAVQVRTSSEQLARYLLALKGHGQLGETRILNDATVDSMFAIESSDAEHWWSYGLFSLDLLWGGRDLEGHSGMAPGCRTAMFFSPDQNTGAVVLTNGEDDYGVMLVLNELLEWGKTVDAPDVPVGPVRLELRANYPNPFTRSTTIPFYLSAAGTARLEVYDITGRRVASLVEGAQNAGLHAVTWDAANAASGIYYTKLEAGGTGAVRQLVRIR